jgi:WD40 repeat protein
MIYRLRSLSQWSAVSAALLWTLLSGTCFALAPEVVWLRAEPAVSHLAFSPDGRTLAVSGFFNFPDSFSSAPGIRWYDASKGTPERSSSAEGAANALAFSPNGRLLAVGFGADNYFIAGKAGTPSMETSTDNVVRWFDASEGQPLRVLEGHTGNVLSLAFSPEGTILASGGGTQDLYNVIGPWKALANSEKDFTLRLWSVPDGRPLRVLSGHQNKVVSIAFSPDGATIASGDLGGAAFLWRTVDGERYRRIDEAGDPIRSVAFSRSGETLAVLTRSNVLRLYQFQTGDLIREVPNVSFLSPDFQTIAFLGNDSLQFRRLSDDSVLRTYRDEIDGISSLAFSPDGATFAYARSSTWIVVAKVPQTRSPMPGDLNADGKADLSDATLALQAVIGLKTADPAALDINGDGKATVQDVVRILRLAIGLG